jgi:hypothetical protein
MADNKKALKGRGASLGRNALEVNETVNDNLCPRCQQAFHCNADDIEHCQCWGIGLGQGEFQYLREQDFSAEVTGCLCRQCLLEIQQIVKSAS